MGKSDNNCTQMLHSVIPSLSSEVNRRKNLWTVLREYGWKTEFDVQGKRKEKREHDVIKPN
jgi:hypothetical protein